jgi:hypothetical protein
VDLPIFVAFWQIECCWTPPAVGDLIAWHLVFEEAVATDVAVGRGLLERLNVIGHQIEERRFERVAPHQWQPTTEAPSYEGVTTSPKWFSHLKRIGDDVSVSQTGILVNVEVAKGPEAQAS